MIFYQKNITINCDVGEGWPVEDQQLIPHVDAINLACGFHAGDPHTMRQTIKLALTHDVKIGAHPSYPDKVNFGRKEMSLPPAKTISMLRYQIAACEGMVNAEGGRLHHIKLHGALYNQSSRDPLLAKTVLMAIQPWKETAALYCPWQSILWRLAQDAGFEVHTEAFIDRRYIEGLQLMPRTEQSSSIKDPKLAHKQLYDMVIHQKVEIAHQQYDKIIAQTYCIHGDNPSAVDILSYIKNHST